MIVTRSRILCAVAVVLLCAVPAGAAESWGPWGTPVARTPTPRPDRDAGDAGILAGSLQGALRFYRTALSPYLGSRCPLYPSCSAYSREAIRRHGPILGVILTADRLMHEADERELATIVMIDGTPRGLDPVEANVWWQRP